MARLPLTWTYKYKEARKGRGKRDFRAFGGRARRALGVATSWTSVLKVHSLVPRSGVRAIPGPSVGPD